MKKNKPTIKEMVAAINTVEPWSDLRYINGKVYTNTYCCFEGAGIKEYSYREVHNIYKSMNKHYKSSSNSVQFFSKLTNRSNRHKSKVAHQILKKIISFCLTILRHRFTSYLKYK